MVIAKNRFHRRGAEAQSRRRGNAILFAVRNNIYPIIHLILCVPLRLSASAVKNSEVLQLGEFNSIFINRLSDNGSVYLNVF